MFLKTPLAGLLLVCLVPSPLWAQKSPDAVRMLQKELIHLGDSKVDWQGVPAMPEGKRLDVAFEDHRRKGTICITVLQFHVDDPWTIQLNGKIVGRLDRTRSRGDHHYELPAEFLEDGKNTLSFVPTKATDDIIIGRVRLYHGTLRERLRLCRAEIQVSGPDGRGLPARITILDAQGQCVPLYYGAGREMALRPGICYAAHGKAAFEIPAGSYRIYATHGPEWGLAEGKLVLEWGSKGQVQLQLSREVETKGYISCDTHIHTLTYSGHGDASMEERMATLGGEGVELAIATDHNHQTDYRPVQQSMDLGDEFKAVTGNEVTTKMGHFNAWPMAPFRSGDTEKQKNAKRPEWRIQDWVKLIHGIRAKGAQAVVLNHPRWPNQKDGPYGRFRLNPWSGDRLSGPVALTFDGMELVNSTTLQDDPLFLVRDWFALLNHGEHIMAVGSSDSHTVRDPVGQGRTYLLSSTDVPTQIDVAEVTENLVKGRSSVSLGIFSECWVDKTGRMGDVVTISGDPIHVQLRVAAPSWVEPQRALVFVNGQKVAEKNVPHRPGKPCDRLLDFQIRSPQHDAWLVCLVIGKQPGPWWPTMKPYSFAATNPVWLDRDGDHAYTDPRRLAEALLTLDADEQRNALTTHDDTVAIQCLSLHWLHLRRRNLKREAILKSLHEIARRLGLHSRPRIREYLATLE